MTETEATVARNENTEGEACQVQRNKDDKKSRVKLEVLHIDNTANCLTRHSH